MTKRLPFEVKILNRATKIIKSHWTKGHLAVDVKGDEVDVASAKAVSFCAIGAIQRAAASLKASENDRYKAIDIVESLIPKPSAIEEYNDDPKRRKRDMISLFNKAVKKATATA